MTNQRGKHWLLLRGLARESAHWGSFIPLLQSTFPDAQISTLDLVGTGQFYQDNSPRNIKAITDIARRQAVERGLLEQPVTVLALSLGGMVAWEWMKNYPDDINGATLINTSFANLSPFYQRLRWQSYWQFFSLLRQRHVYQRELAIVQLVNNSRHLDDQIARDWGQIQTLRPVSMKNMLQQIIAASRYRPDNTKPNVPVLLLNAQGDRLVAPACSAAIQQRWQLELRTHIWAGHDLTQDDGAWVVAQLSDWLTAAGV